MDIWYFLIGTGAFGVLLTIGVKLYAKWSCGRYEIKQDLSGKNVLITGANGGIGKVTSLELARAGASIHMLCRNKEKAEKAAEEIRKETKNDRITVWVVDISSMRSVREFCERFLATNLPIHVLINNAGISSSGSFWEEKRTDEGLDVMWATNHFGHFLLTNLLLDRIKESKPVRIIMVSSIVHRLFTLDLDRDVNNNPGGWWTNFRHYCLTKMANILFSNELSRRLEATGVTVNSLHPGAVNTDLFGWIPGLLRYPGMAVLGFFFKTPEEGAQTSLYLAAAPELEHVTGSYFWDNKPASMILQALDEDLALRLWNLSQDIVDGIN